MDSMLHSSAAPQVVDCRGLQCPAPILKLAEVARKQRGTGAQLTVLATDSDFPVDLEAWCRTTKSSLVRLEREDDGLIRAQVRLEGAAPTIPSAPIATPQPVPAPPAPAPAEPSISESVIDLTGTSIVVAMRRLNELSVAAAGLQLTILCDAPGFEGRLAAWSSATDTDLLKVHRDGRRVTAVLVFPSDQAISEARASTIPGLGTSAREPAQVIVRAAAPEEPERRPPPAAMPSAQPVISRPAVPVKVVPAPDAQPVISKSTEPAPVIATAALTLARTEPEAEDVVPRENRATLLVLHNDLEALLAALMVANASASQGMAVEVYFAFWGIHLLRGERPRREAPESNRGIIQAMMLWMVPKGPSRQKLGKLHMGGIGTKILLWLMRKRNILALDKLVESAVAQGVQLRVCSMSMGLMGLSQRDIVDLPNLSFAGVTSFAESARRSAVSLVF